MKYITQRPSFVRVCPNCWGYVCFLLLWIATPLSAQSAPASRPSARKVTTKRTAPRLETRLQAWFRRTQTRLQTLYKQLPKTKGEARFRTLRDLAKEYKTVVRIHELLLKKYDTYRGTSTWAKLKTVRLQADRQSRLFRVKTAQLYQQILTEFPKHKQLCDIYNGLGSALVRLRQPQLAVRVFRDLLKAYPKQTCRFAPNAHLQIGEYFFNNNQVKAASTHYQKVLAFPPNRYTAFAHYKLAWCWYNFNQHKKALQAFLQTLQYLKRAPAHALPKHVAAVERETRRDLVMAYAHAGSPKQAIAFFTKHTPLHAPELLQTLPKRYRDQGKYQDALLLMKQLLARATLPLQQLVWKHAILAFSLKVERFTEHLTAAKQLTTHYLTLRNTCIKTIACLKQKRASKTLLYKWGEKLHRESNKTRRTDGYQQAYKAYQQFLVAFGKDKDSALIWFRQGEVLMALKLFNAARVHYQQMLAINRQHPYAKDAAYNSIVAQHRHMQQLAQKKALSPSLQKQGYLTMLHDSERMTQLFPRDKRARTVFLTATSLALKLGQIKRSKQLVQTMVQLYPQDQTSVSAAKIIFRYYQQAKRWKAYANWADTLSQTSGWKGTPVGKQYTGLAQSVRRQIKALKAKRPTPQRNNPTP